MRLFGPDILVAPILYENARTRRVYLPRGSEWIDVGSGKAVPGGEWQDGEAPVSTIPLFLRKGSELKVEMLREKDRGRLGCHDGVTSTETPPGRSQPWPAIRAGWSGTEVMPEPHRETDAESVLSSFDPWSSGDHESARATRAARSCSTFTPKRLAILNRNHSESRKSC
jgi:hypothetical protein